MSNLNFRSSNIYLKSGVALLAIFVVMLIASFALPSVTNQLPSFWTGLTVSFFSGIVLYLLGRVVQVRQARAHG